MYAEISELALISSLIFVSCIYGALSDQDLTFRECRKSDPNFKQCFLFEIQRNIPYLKNGYTKFNIPPIDPFEVPELLTANGFGLLAIDLRLQKTKIYGLSSAQFSKFQIDPNELSGNGTLVFNKPIELIGSYKVKGRISQFHVDSDGTYNITFVNPRLDLYNVKGGIHWKEGVKYITVKSINLKVVKIKKIYLQFDNLYKDNPELTKNLNAFLNDAWRLLFDELKAPFEEHIVNIVKTISTNILNEVPADTVFPE